MIFILAFISFAIRFVQDLFPYKYSPDQCDPEYYRFSLLKKNSTFLIHGLWIEQCAQCLRCGYPSSCDPNCDFNITELGPIWNDLHQYWYGGNDPSKNTLLPHEWCKHGTCTNLTELSYFNRSLNIYKQILDGDLLSLCNYHSNECYFILDKNLSITNSTKWNPADEV